MSHTEIDKRTGNFSYNIRGVTVGMERCPQGQPSFASPPFHSTLVWKTAIPGRAAAGVCLLAGSGLPQSGLVRQRDEWSEVWKGGKGRRAEEGLGGWVTD